MALCRTHRIEAVSVRRVDEVRPVQDGNAVTVGRTSWTTLVGYRDGVLIRTVLADPPADLDAQLAAEGFRVRALSDNIS